MRLGLAAYSFRQFFKEASEPGSQAAPDGRPFDMLRFIDYCSEQGCDGAEVTSYYFPPQVSNDYLLKVKQRAFLKGVALSGTAVGNTFTLDAGPKREEQMTLVKRWVDNAALMGAPHIRVFAGNTQKGSTFEQAVKNCIAALEEAADYSGSKGVFLGIENHGGIVASSKTLVDIVEAVKSPWVGINLDTGNFHTEDPYADLAKCAARAINVQFKAEIRAAKEKKSSPADVSRIIRILRDVGYLGYLTLEYESSESPWTAVPRLLNSLRDGMSRGSI